MQYCNAALDPLLISHLFRKSSRNAFGEFAARFVFSIRIWHPRTVLAHCHSPASKQQTLHSTDVSRFCVARLAHGFHPDCASLAHYLRKDALEFGFEFRLPVSVIL
jgi:hypothetical protein